MNGIYIHIPFCKKKCNYCNFVSGIFPNRKDYFQALLYEIKNREVYFNKANTIYIGGGTPSSVEMAYIENIVKALDARYNLSRLKEFTIELNPESVNKEKILFYKSLGVNRFSIGIQSYDDKILRYLGRPHRKKEIINALTILEKNTKNYSIDLIWGIRNSKPNFKILDDFSPKHVSLYLLSIDKGSKLYKKKEKEKKDIFIEKEYYYILENLYKRNYKRYEVSNFSKKGFESKHNNIYWNIDDIYMGYGISASGYNKKIRYTNTINYNKYIKDPLFTKRETIDNEKKKIEEIMLGLRKQEGIKVNRKIEKITSKCVLSYLIKNGFIIKRVNKIYLSDKGFLLLNSIIIELLNK